MTSNGKIDGTSYPITELSTFSYAFDLCPNPWVYRQETSSHDLFCPNYKAIHWRIDTEGFPGQSFKATLKLMSSDRHYLYCEVELSVSHDGVIHEPAKKFKIAFSCVGEQFTFAPFPMKGKLIKVNLLMKLKGTVKPASVKDTAAQIQLPIISLTEDLRNLLDKTGDLTLTLGKEKIKVHKTMMAARSPVFAAMIDAKVPCNELIIPGVNLGVMLRVVHYLYNDNVNDIKVVAEQLYPVACRYALLGLKAMCEDTMLDSLTVENAAKFLVLADGKPGTFKARVVNCMKNRSAEVMVTATFKSMALSHPQLLLEVFCAMNDDTACTNPAA